MDFHRCLRAVFQCELVHREHLAPLHFHNLLDGVARPRLSILHVANLFAKYHIKKKKKLRKSKEIYSSKVIKGYSGYILLNPNDNN